MTINKDKVRAPKRYANKISTVLNQVLGPDRYPIEIADIAKQYTQECFPDDPITLVKGDSLPGFEGALYRAPPGKKGWGIIYNSDITSLGRVNFTLAHEFGHYLLHRSAYPDGIECNANDITDWNSEYGQVENQANEFAATLLMPLDDYRKQLNDSDKPSFSEISACADRYDVSLIAAVLRWLQYTVRRACIIVSRDGYILWARSSSRAYKSGIYIKTTNRRPIAIPASSLAANRGEVEAHKGLMRHESGVWFQEECEEQVIFSDQYDFTISLLHLSN